MILPGVFGLTVGALYGLLQAGDHGLIRDGAGLGLGTWAANRAGWLPAPGQSETGKGPARRRPASFLALHLLFGCITAAIYRRLARRTLHMSSPAPAPPPDTVAGNFSRQDYASQLEPLVARAAAGIEAGKRAYLGSLQDLVPSQSDSPPFIDAADEPWFAALEEVARRHGVSYELVTDRSGGTLWLVPSH
jgi:hypothetical protein